MTVGTEETVEWQGTTHRCGGGVPPHVTLGRFVAGKGGSLLPDGGLSDAQLGTPCVYTKEARRHSACYAHKHLRTQLHAAADARRWSAAPSFAPSCRRVDLSLLC